MRYSSKIPAGGTSISLLFFYYYITKTWPNSLKPGLVPCSGLILGLKSLEAGAILAQFQFLVEGGVHFGRGRYVEGFVFPSLHSGRGRNGDAVGGAVRHGGGVSLTLRHLKTIGTPVCRVVEPSVRIILRTRLNCDPPGCGPCWLLADNSDSRRLPRWSSSPQASS